MDPLSIDNAIYEEVDHSRVVPAKERFEVEKNQCYAVSNRETAPGDVRNRYKKVLLFLVLTSILLLAVAGACAALTLQITKLKSEIASLNYQLELNRQNDSMIESAYQQLKQESVTLENRTQHNIEFSYQQLKQEFAAVDNRTHQLNSSIFGVIEDLSGQFQFYPAISCAALPPSFPSGYYWVRAFNGSAVSVYCDMTRSCGGVTGGWMRVFELDMTNDSHQCPSGLIERNDLSIRTCVPNSVSASCSSVSLPISNEYSKVCGKIIAYQVGSPNTFAGYTGSSVRVDESIDTYYVDGVSLTYGNPRHHIWTFAAGLDESGFFAYSNCPCTDTTQNSSATPPPEYVGDDYFCDTGSEGRFQNGNFYSDDPLWDGAGCGPLNACCSFNNPPWFYKELPQSTTDDIEMRVCKDQDAINEDIAVEMISIYVQ